MKFCYADESGHGYEPILVVAGVIVDAQRMHRTKEDWDALLLELNEISEGRVVELKAGQLYRGNDYWRQWDGGERTALIEDIIRWMNDRNHRLTFAAINKKAFFDARDGCALPTLGQASLWSAGAMHLILSLQKTHQSEKKNKGKTVVVFDEVQEAGEFLELMGTAWEETQGFYERGTKQAPLDQIVDVPFFADSKMIGLLQVADLFAYIFRLYAELADGLGEQKFEGELQRLSDWMGDISKIMLPDAARWSSKSKDLCVEFYRSVAPPALLKVA